MSNFKCTTKTEDEISNGPLIFSQLEILANVLVSETLDLQQEFKTKAQFVNEQFMNNFKNEKETENIYYMSQKLQQEFSSVEMELQALECLFQRFERILQTLEISSKRETFYLRYNCGCGYCCLCRCKTERQKFFELLEETNRKLEELPGLLEDMKEIGTYWHLKSPYSDILTILSYHCEILKGTEKNMNILLDQLSLIEIQQQQLKRQIK